jgi:hypothetical protein
MRQVSMTTDGTVAVPNVRSTRKMKYSKILQGHIGTGIFNVNGTLILSLVVVVPYNGGSTNGVSSTDSHRLGNANAFFVDAWKKTNRSAW